MFVSTLTDFARTMSERLEALGGARSGDITDLAPRALDALRDKASNAATILREASPAIGALPNLDVVLSEPLTARAAQTISGELSALLDLRCRPDSIVPISVNRISRALGKLRTATEAFAPFEDLVFQLAMAVNAQSPTPYPDAVYLNVAKALIVIGTWESERTKVDRDLTQHEAIPALLATLGRGQALGLSFFICPPSYYPALSLELPAEYFPTSLEGSFLQSQIAGLSDLTKRLDRIGVPTRIVAIIGDCDETDYLWPVLGTPDVLQDPATIAQIEQRKIEFEQAVNTYLARAGLTDPDMISVCRLSKLKPPFREQLGEEISSAIAGIGQNAEWFNDGDRDREIERMRELWASGGYYEGLPFPTESDLRAIVGRKFAAYAEEGLLLGENPTTQNTVLIQLEKPPLLRNRMLNAAREMVGCPRWPAVLFYSPEESIRTPEFGAPAPQPALVGA